jgi:cardiolipin synthase A/B
VIGAALTNRRVLQPVEARIMLITAVVLFAFAVFFAFFPRLLAYPLVVLCLWVSLAFLYRSYKLRR